MTGRHTITTPVLTLTDVSLRRGRYDDGSTALVAIVATGDVEVLSINLAAYGHLAPEDHVFVKDYSEHQGLPDALAQADLAERVDRMVCGPLKSPYVLMRLTEHPR